MTSFASENAYQTLDNATTDDESATLLTAPELPAVEDVAVNVGGNARANPDARFVR
jgi:hypothetical protein